MSIIQSIRDKAAWIISAAIGLALLAFIVQDAFQNRSMFSDNPTTIGTINGLEVSPLEFEEKFKRAEEQYRQVGYPINDMMRGNIRESIWNEYVEDGIMSERYEDLGLTVSEKELSDILYGANPPSDLRQQFTDPNTGQYDANKAYEQIQALRRDKKNPNYASFFDQYLPALSKNRQKEKYISLLANSVYVPKWLAEKQIAENSQKAAISFVNVPYASLPDSSFKVTDEAINQYVNDHKEEYKQEASRSIDYVMFDAGPTKADSMSIFDQVSALKAEFASTDDPKSFLIRNGSETPFFDGYILQSKMQMENPDSIKVLEPGQVRGPYIDGGSYVLARMIDKRVVPDSVKVRHILIQTVKQGTPVLDDSTARKRIDSIATAARSGAPFDSLVVKFTDDEGSRNKGGEYDFTSLQIPDISKEFAEVAFYGRTGDKKVVKVDNPNYAGYHYIEVLNQSNFEQGYKVAYLARAIVPSQVTGNRVNGLASQFAAESRNKKEFDANVRAKKLNKFSATDVKPLDAMIQGLGSSRELVRWMYQAEVGDVPESPIVVEDKYIVPVLTRIYEEGVMPAEKARPLVENILRNQLKAKQIQNKVGNANSLDAVSKASGQAVLKADSVLFSSPFVPNVGQELKVVGASFNKAYQSQMSPAIEGNGGVFYIKVDNVSAIANANLDVVQQQAGATQMLQRMLGEPRAIVDALKSTVKIKDNRHRFF
jgi:peptidyl-prolyl cis-trans isomerase D